MFDFRYHVASLAAVFVALVVGIVIGVGIAGQGVLEATERDIFRAQIEQLRREREAARARVEARAAAEQYVERTYDVVMDARLQDREIAVVFVGPIESGLRSAVSEAVRQADGTLARIRAFHLPIDADELASALAGDSALASLAGDDNLRQLGREVGREIVAGAETPVLDALAGKLIEEEYGPMDDPVEAVVVGRTAEPQRAETAIFLRGLYEGLTGSVPAVGVELSSAADSAIDVYRRAGLSSVDNVDSEVGRVSLAVLLAGGEEGHYGLKDTADAAMPPVEPVLPPEPRG